MRERAVSSACYRPSTHSMAMSFAFKALSCLFAASVAVMMLKLLVSCTRRSSSAVTRALPTVHEAGSSPTRLSWDTDKRSGRAPGATLHLHHGT